jgi:hypothetical protein
VKFTLKNKKFGCSLILETKNDDKYSYSPVTVIFGDQPVDIPVSRWQSTQNLILMALKNYMPDGMYFGTVSLEGCQNIELDAALRKHPYFDYLDPKTLPADPLAEGLLS